MQESYLLSEFYKKCIADYTDVEIPHVLCCAHIEKLPFRFGRLIWYFTGQFVSAICGSLGDAQFI